MHTPLPLGFSTSSTACGIKGDPARPDLSLFVSDRDCTAVGVFTTNRVVGAPVKVCRERVPQTAARSVIINAGNANACTGERGLDDARWMTAEVAQGLKCRAEQVLVASTGVIGRFLPREKLAAGIPRVLGTLSPSPESFHGVARAMMTTDTVPKQASRVIIGEGGQEVTLSGVCKGAAMIAPNMATMLCVIMTDAALAPDQADKALRAAMSESFHCISIDQHQSTSDTVLLLANGAAGVASPQLFQTALNEVCSELAQKIVRDAEGASHFVTLDVTGLEDRQAAERIARAVCDSPLVKTAITGNDPNWGRIVSAAGYAGVPFEEHEVSLTINGLKVFHQGAPTTVPVEDVSAQMKTGEIHMVLEFTRGNAAVRYWTCDLTTEYVRLNADYTT